MKKISFVSAAIAGIIAASTLFTGCFGKAFGTAGTGSSTVSSASDSGSKVITIGYAQAGHESNWRMANTKSFEDTFTEAKGYKLLLDDADGSIERQIAAVRTFINDKVDYIVLAPVVETGWDDILRDAKNAGIPVILSDRQLKTDDDSLYLCWVGGNFLKEGRDSVKWLENYLEENGRANKRVNIVDIQGTMGSSAQKGRTKGIEEGVRAHDNWKLVAQECADFDETTAKAVMSYILSNVGSNNIDVVFAENDNMAWGVCSAIKAAGKIPGKDIIVISFDAVKDTFVRMIAGEINCACECNPLHGPRVEEIIKTLEKGETVDRIQYVSEGVFDQSNAATVLPTRAY